MNLKDELIRADRKRQKSYPQVSLEPLKARLAHDVQMEESAITSMGLSSSRDKIETKHTWLKQHYLVQQYDGDVYHVNDVKKICMDYRMRMLPSSYYHGYIDTEFGVKVRNFQEAHNLSTYDMETNFYIVAPKEAFNLERRERPVNFDPLLLYKVDDDYYKLVHQWGPDLNIFRFIWAWSQRDLPQMSLHRFIVTFVIALLLSGVIFYNFVHAIVFSMAIATFFTGIHYLMLSTNIEEMKDRFSRFNWNQPWTF
jgi:hypothetical protein